MKILSLIAILAALFLSSETAQASDTLVFDSTDHYLGACQMTNKSSWELTKDIKVSKFQVWYKWNQGETSLPVTVLKDGEKFASFEAKRGDCDPYQTTWCNADYELDTLMPAATYSTEIPTNRQCLKPNGTGTIRLYSNDSQTAENSPSPTQSPTLPPQPTNTPAIIPVTANATVTTPCSCNQTATIAAAAAISSLLSITISLFLRKK